MIKIFVLYEERENSQLCGIRGVWSSKEDAVSKMSSLIASNPLYSNYCVKEFEV